MSEPKVTRRKLSDYRPTRHNPNRHTERGLQIIEDSANFNGAGRSGLVDKDGNLLAGNGTWEALARAGIEDVLEVETDGHAWVIVKRVDLEDGTPKAEAIKISDNRASELGYDPDQELLGALLANIAAEDEALLRGAGFTEHELADLLESIHPTPAPDPGAQIDRAEELQQVWQVQRGDLWVIKSMHGGEHRLLCGDSTNAEDVARVLDDEQFNLCATSPPYANQRDYEIGDFDWLGLMTGVSANVFNFMADTSHFLVNLGLNHLEGRVDRYWDAWLDWCQKNSYPLFGWYVWDKGSGFPGEWNGRLAPAHEFVFHFKSGSSSARKWIETSGESKKRGSSGKRFRQKDGTLKELYSPGTIGQPFKIPDSVIRIGREMARGIHTEVHPAVFSVEFAQFFVNTWSVADDIVYEPFSGSGTTLVACEQTGRQGRGIEIAEKYCAVTLQRLADMGLNPTRDRNLTSWH